MKNTLFVALVFTAINTASVAENTSLEKVISSNQCSETHKARDACRHKKQTLKFFDVKDTMTVVEIWSSKSGWYTKIFAPYLLKIMANFMPHILPVDSKVKFFRTISSPKIMQFQHEFCQVLWLKRFCY